ncbi:hypothetical protein [Flavivirga eckloniae]|uniref:Gliding motility protein n=1 Tax=Flavivirga eckloniae TaxID=1803846 RepID=A0A2K9PPA6_9FLAO|nr:hypothetical protein [Flavivirga eckloniae]AUP78903.1 hypothetical protein C1H87_09395 [Flavivirga eckloniae]
MKRIFTIAAVFLFTAITWAQSPEKMTYQAVVRDASNVLVANQTVGTQISIIQGSVNGTTVYVETHVPNSNANGLISLEIGSGTIVSGAFNSIDWSKGPYFIKIETDPKGGTTYTIKGTSQLLSVPYALHAKTAETISGGSRIITINEDTTLDVGDQLVFINGPYIVSFPASPVDGMKLVICSIYNAARISGNGKILRIAGVIVNYPLSFGILESNMVTFYYSSVMDAWIGGGANG